MKRVLVTLMSIGLLAGMAALVPLLTASTSVRAAAVRAFLGLAISHVIVQILKRNVLRVRPTEELGHESLVRVPELGAFDGPGQALGDAGPASVRRALSLAHGTPPGGAGGQ